MATFPAGIKNLGCKTEGAHIQRLVSLLQICHTRHHPDWNSSEGRRLQFGGGFPVSWGGPDVVELECMDRTNLVKMELKRIKE